MFEGEARSVCQTLCSAKTTSENGERDKIGRTVNEEATQCHVIIILQDGIFDQFALSGH